MSSICPGTAYTHRDFYFATNDELGMNWGGFVMSDVLYYVMGIFAGLAVAAVVLLLRTRSRKSKGVVPAEKYDERQQLARGKAFKAAFFILMIYTAIQGMLATLLGLVWCDMLTSAVIGICLALTVFLIISILNDAYITLQESPSRAISIFVACSMMNLVVGISTAEKEAVIAGGQLTYHALNLIIAAMFFIVLVVFVGKWRHDSSNARQE
jgi:MFS family permease